MRTQLTNWLLTNVTALIVVGGMTFIPSVVQGEETFQDRSSKVSFPTEVSFDINGTKHTLQATGAATRTKFFVKVYALASYVENPVKTSVDALVKQILDGNPARQFTLHWLHKADTEKLKSGFIESLQKSTTPAEFAAFEAPINEYLKAYNEEINPGDIIVVRWFPDGSLHVYRNDKLKAEIKDNNFARAVWNVSIGPNSVVKREELFSLIFPK